MVTAPPAVTIPEDQRWEVVVRLVTADEWDAICARLAKLDRIEATRRAVKAGPAIPSPSDWEAFIDALDGEP